MAPEPRPRAPHPRPPLGLWFGLGLSWSLTKPWVFWDAEGSGKVPVSIKLLVVQLVLARMSRTQHGEVDAPTHPTVRSGMSSDASSKSHLIGELSDGFRVPGVTSLPFCPHQTPCTSRSLEGDPEVLGLGGDLGLLESGQHGGGTCRGCHQGLGSVGGQCPGETGLVNV